MSDRPDWLPEPTPEPSRPLSERLHLAAVSVASLLLGIVGILLIFGGALQGIIWARQGGLLQVSLRYAASSVVPGISFLGTAYLMRWCLRRLREESNKNKTLRSKLSQSN
jgi:hypothetical protein